MRITQKLVGIGMLAMMAGCSTLSSLNPFSSKVKANPPAPLVELKGSMAVRTAWKLDMGKADNYMFTPALVGTTVVLAGAGGALARDDEFDIAFGRSAFERRFHAQSRTIDGQSCAFAAGQEYLARIVNIERSLCGRMIDASGQSFHRARGDFQIDFKAQRNIAAAFEDFARGGQ